MQEADPTLVRELARGIVERVAPEELDKARTLGLADDKAALLPDALAGALAVDNGPGDQPA